MSSENAARGQFLTRQTREHALEFDLKERRERFNSRPFV